MKNHEFSVFGISDENKDLHGRYLLGYEIRYSEKDWEWSYWLHYSDICWLFWADSEAESIMGAEGANYDAQGKVLRSKAEQRIA